jgi:hypothetical protein
LIDRGGTLKVDAGSSPQGYWLWHRINRRESTTERNRSINQCGIR